MGGVTDLAALRAEALGCTKCPLAATRTQVVFGVGDEQADLMFVGEGPGADEDRIGEPFVGRAGKLLTSLIEDIGLTRAEVYIANVVKCRPPGNRDPQPIEIESCRPFLERQLELVAPRVVVTLGNFATKLLLDTKIGITKLRGQEHPYRDGVLIPVLHPSAVLRNGGAALGPGPCGFRRHPPRAGAMSSTLESQSPATTRALGVALAGLLQVGDVLVLSGELGAGKTELAKAIAAALGVTEPVVSPTFAILREYEGAMPVFHLDVYRLDHVQEAMDLALDEIMESGITMIEWGEGIRELLPPDHLQITLAYGPPGLATEQQRVVTVTAHGPGWATRVTALDSALAAAVEC